MLISFFFGFVAGFLALLALQGFAILWALDRLRRKAAPSEVSPAPAVARDLNGERSLSFPCSKKGIVWILESQKFPNISSDDSPTKEARKQKNKKNIMEVFPVKKYAEIKDHSLILSDNDGSVATIHLVNCAILAVSASNLSSRKWAKRYPIKLESKDSFIYNGSKICFLYLDTSWEKESWCKALRLASCTDEEKLHWYAQLWEDFHNYLASLNAEYPAFFKPSVMFDEVTDRTIRNDGSSRVRLFLKKLAKKASKNGLEMKQNSGSLLNHGDRKIDNKIHSIGELSSSGVVKSSSEEKSSVLSNSLQDMVQPTSPTLIHLTNKSSFPGSSDPACYDKSNNDEGTLCWNLLFSRLFFDAKRSVEINSVIRARIQKTLSNIRIPSYVGELTCTGFDLGKLPPYIHRMRVNPMDLNEVWAVEVDLEYSGGLTLDIETRLEVCEPELQNDIMETSSNSNYADEVNTDLLEGLEHFGNQLKLSRNLTSGKDTTGDKADGLGHSKSTTWTSNYVSRWKNIIHSIADQVSQVPLSLTIRVASLRGTLRLHIKPAPSDQLWYGFTMMPEIDWNLESAVGERKITSSHISLLIGNRFKAAIRDSLVLPNCGSICIPWMLAEKDDWVPQKVAPFIWINQEATDVNELDLSNSETEEAKLKLDGRSKSTADSIVSVEDKVEKVKNVIHVEQPPLVSPSELPSGCGLLGSVPSKQPSYCSISDELRKPLLRTETDASSDHSKMELSSASLSGAVTVPCDGDAPKRNSTRAKMKDFGKRMGDKLEEKRRHLEEKSRHIVEKMLENTKT